jgi:hypothetical protein
MKLTPFIILIFIFFNTLHFSQTQFGDTLFSFNAGTLTPTQDRNLKALEFALDHYWIIGMNPPFYDHRLYKIRPEDNTLVSFTSLGTGYQSFQDLAFDGQFLYATNKDVIVQIDPNTGLLTGVTIPADFGYLLAQGLAYDPATDHFWVMPHRNGQLQIIYEIDRAGNIIRSFPNKTTDYTASLTWDNISPNGPFLWTFSRVEVGYDNQYLMRQFSPAIGQFTGVEIEMVSRSPVGQDGVLAIALTQELDTSVVTMIALQSGSFATNDGLDWIVVYNADLRNQGTFGSSISVDPPSIQLQIPYGDSLLIPVLISNSGNANLQWNAFVENTDSSAFSSGELGDTLFSLDFTNLIADEDIVLRGLTYARDHYWLVGYINSTVERFIFEVDKDGNLVNTYPQSSLNFFGWGAVTTDGEFLYAPDTYGIIKWSLDSKSTVGIIPVSNIYSTAITYDPNQKYFYVGSSQGSIRVVSKEGQNVSFLITPYSIEDLSWDNYSPGGPFLWAWVRDDSLTGAKCQALRLNPQSGEYTGVGFEGENIGTAVNFPLAATIYPDPTQSKLIFAGLQKSNDNSLKKNFLVGYDLAVAPPPAWVHILHPTIGIVEPDGTNTLLVKFHAMMADTTTGAVIKIYNNDLSQPLVQIPITVEMLESFVTSVDNNQFTPGKFSMEQNYPNPFNPSTTIKYQIPVASNVSIKIYDILGSEVATLIDEFKAAGVYEVNFDASKLSSGVYLYKIQAGSFVQTKKMILMK